LNDALPRSDRRPGPHARRHRRPISLNAVSKHLKLLERASLVDRRVAGRDHFIRVRPEPLQAAQAWIATQQAFWRSRLAGIDALLTAGDTAPAQRPPSGDCR
jgi:hypothetical protein